MCSPGSYKSIGIVSVEFRVVVELIWWTEGEVCFQTQSFSHAANFGLTCLKRTNTVLSPIGSMLDIMRW